ncbi:DUF6090 family protein [Mariniflexile sp.]|uniref:DUF6090 family protein n=2 Tax=Mariniflexile sp. TaxID=1979402 RepID=UPI00404898BB
MIKIFRNIRKNLLAEGKTSKYLKYAIGEIILVVIGILIALSINNWNQERILKIEEEGIVRNIHNEYLQNKTIIKTSLEESDSCANTLKILMDLIGKDEALINNHNIDSLLFYAIDPPIFRPSENTISGLIQSGRLELLHNQELVDLIYEWGRTMKSLNDRSARVLIKIDDEVLPYLTKKYALKDVDAYGHLKWENKTNLTIDKLQIFQEIEFENIMDDYIYRVVDCKNRLVELDLIINKILKETYVPNK